RNLGFLPATPGWEDESHLQFGRFSEVLAMLSVRYLWVLCCGIGLIAGLKPVIGRAAPLPKRVQDEEKLAKKAADLGREATNLYRQGKVEDALGRLEEALKIRKKLFRASEYPNGHPDLAETLHNMGFMLLALGRPKEALPFCENAVAMRRKLYAN